MNPADKYLLKLLLKGPGSGLAKLALKGGGPYGWAAQAALDAAPYIEDYYGKFPGHVSMPVGRGTGGPMPQFSMPGAAVDPFMGMRQTPVPANKSDQDWDALQQIATERLAALMEVAKKRRAAGGNTKDVSADWQAIRKAGLLHNAGDYIRGAGIATPKKGDVRINSLQLKQPSR